MSEMTTSEAIERIQNIIERGNQINRGVHFMDNDLQALDKAIEVMEEKEILKQIVIADTKVKKYSYEMNVAVRDEDFDKACSYKINKDKFYKDYLEHYGKWYNNYIKEDNEL